ncbi:MAG: hypothetical protein NVS3B26_07970 [Mycobacteriales bacterium]
MTRQDSSASVVNDAGLEVHEQFDVVAPREHPALARWREWRREQGRPFRPNFKMYVGHTSPAATGERVKLLQSLGAESILLAWDLPSQLGLDPDHRLARSQVGRAGVSCSSLDDMREICAEVDLTALVSFGMLANSVGPIGLGMVLEVLEEAGAAGTGITLQNDPLKEFTARGTDIFTPAASLRLACDVVEYAVQHDIPGQAMTVCSNHYDVAGAGPVLALAFALANGLAYLDELVARGVDPTRAAEKISFFVNERSDFFVTAALFRTTRVLWADLTAARYGVEPDGQPLHVMGYAHGLETAAEPLVNVARVAVSVTAATLGGADTLCVAAYDEALRIPSADAAALALRTLQVASLEHGVSDSVDPLAGSYKFEALCRTIEHDVREELARIEDRGGAVVCIDNDYVLSRMADQQEHRPLQLSSGDRPWVGVNVHQAPAVAGLFAGASGTDFGVAETEHELIERVRARKATASGEVEASLTSLTADLAAGANSVDATRRALRAGATVEQITDAMRHGLGLVPATNRAG